MIQLFDPPGVFRIGLMTPVLTVLLIACAIARAQRIEALQQGEAEGQVAGVSRS